MNQNLFPCPDCGNSCSTTATSCPKCGRILSFQPTPTKSDILRKLLFAGLAGFAIVLGYFMYADAQRSKSIDVAIAENQRLEKMTYTEPKVGMLFTKLTELCGDVDEYNESESTRTKIIRVSYKRSEKNILNKCAGNYTFINYKLDTITR